MLPRLKAGITAAIMATAAALPASSATYELTTQYSDSYTGSVPGAFHTTVDLKYNVMSGINGVPATYGDGRAEAGRFQLRATDSNGSTNFIAYCLELGQSLFRNHEDATTYRTYTTGTYLAQNVTDRLGKLAHLAWDLVNSSNKAAAFQLAVWEITHDNADGDLSLTSGSFRSEEYNFWDFNWNGTSSAVQQQAQSWLNTIKGDGYTGMRKMTFLHSDNSQDLWTDLPDTDPNPVPVPAAGFALLSGLGLLSALRRRRRT